MNLVYPPLVLCSGISTFIPFFASSAIVRQINKHQKSLAFLWVFFLVAAATEVTLYILNLWKTPSTWVSHVYTLIEYVLITAVLAGWQTRSTIVKLMRTSVPIYFLLFAITKVLGVESLSTNANNYITRPLAIVLLGAFTFLTLQDVWRHTPGNLTNDYRFWMLLAMALYYSASLFLFAFMSVKDREFLIALFEIHAVVNIVHNILFTIGVLHVRRAPQPALPVSAG